MEAIVNKDGKVDNVLAGFMDKKIKIATHGLILSIEGLWTVMASE